MPQAQARSTVTGATLPKPLKKANAGKFGWEDNLRKAGLILLIFIAVINKISIWQNAQADLSAMIAEKEGNGPTFEPTKEYSEGLKNKTRENLNWIKMSNAIVILTATSPFIPVILSSTILPLLHITERDMASDIHFLRTVTSVTSIIVTMTAVGEIFLIRSLQAVTDFVSVYAWNSLCHTCLFIIGSNLLIHEVALVLGPLKFL